MKKLILLLVVCFSLNLQAQERQIETSDGVKLYVCVKGTGTPCLYIHGGPGSGSYWLQKFYGDYLEKHFQMIYLDQRGVGRSSSPKNNDFSMERMILDFETVRENLGIKKWLTLGHSFGGILQMGYVKECPKSIEGMLMINCTMCIAESFKSSWIPKAAELGGVEYSLPQGNSPDSILSEMMKVSAAMEKTGSRWKMTYSLQENDQLMNASYSEIKNWNNDFGNSALSIGEYWCDYRPYTKKVKKPVLFFYGKTDWMIGPDHYKGVKFSNMMLRSSKAGHMPFMEDKDVLEKAIADYNEKYGF